MPVAKKNEWLTKCLSQDAAEVRREMLAEYSAQQVPREWPTAPAERTIAMLREEADVLRDRGYRKRAAAEEAKQKKQLAKMANNPESFLKQVDKLVAQQSVAAYREASKLLHELQDALREKGQNAMVEAHARRLTEKYPTRTRLLSELRREGILKK